MKLGISAIVALFALLVFLPSVRAADFPVSAQPAAFQAFYPKGITCTGPALPATQGIAATIHSCAGSSADRYLKRGWLSGRSNPRLQGWRWHGSWAAQRLACWEESLWKVEVTVRKEESYHTTRLYG